MWSLKAFRYDLKYGLIRAGLEATSSSFVQRLFPHAGGRGIIFTLHHVRPESQTLDDPNRILSVTPQFLEEAIVASKECGLTPVHLHDLPSLLAEPSDRRRFVAFTLDDGYRNNAEYAAPIFRRFEIPFTIFINPGFVERTRSIWWETAALLTRQLSAFSFDFGDGPEVVSCMTRAEKFSAFDRLAVFVRSVDEDEAVAKIDDLAQSHGFVPMDIVRELVMDEKELKSLALDPLVHFGAHTINHINMQRVSAPRLQTEIEDSIAAVADYVGARPRSFSYPYGWTTAVGDREARAVADAGIQVGVTTQPGVLTASRLSEPQLLPRVSLNGYYQKKRYVKALISGIPFKFMG